MELTDIKKIIDMAVSGEINSDMALDKLKVLAGSDIGYAKIDYQRSLRNGFPEVIYCPGKRKEHLQGIIRDMLAKSTGNIMASRADQEAYEAIKAVYPEVMYYEAARIALVKRQEFGTSKKHILVVTAGTADIPVAEEAAITAEILGNKVNRLFDVGVAGIHRLLSKVESLREANVVIVVAGMEGALPSVVGGLVDKPVIAVPTSVGYGASFNGLSALLGMLNSCASGLAVMNIDNGFGAACLANRINKLSEEDV
ncbi:MAG: nickel pincer cofactor biosynthesis protein LarB [Clostridia bacterium]|nr:nickel pincer cofactor biosynthesis protein LarB [Clostridia bacterium]